MDPVLQPALQGSLLLRFQSTYAFWETGKHCSINAIEIAIAKMDQILGPIYWPVMPLSKFFKIKNIWLGRMHARWYGPHP